MVKAPENAKEREQAQHVMHNFCKPLHDDGGNPAWDSMRRITGATCMTGHCIGVARSCLCWRLYASVPRAVLISG